MKPVRIDNPEPHKSTLPTELPAHEKAARRARTSRAALPGIPSRLPRTNRPTPNASSSVLRFVRNPQSR